MNVYLNHGSLVCLGFINSIFSNPGWSEMQSRNLRVALRPEPSGLKNQHSFRKIGDSEMK